MRNTILLTIICLLCHVSPGQVTIHGSFQSMSCCKSEVYLSAIENYHDVFAAKSEYRIDTTLVDETGNFTFQLDKLPCEDCLYRIDVNPVGQNRSFVVRSAGSQNSALFALNNNQLITIRGNASKLARTFKLESEHDNWSYESIRELREPVYIAADKIRQLFSNTEKHPVENKDSLKREGLRQYRKIFQKSNNQLKRVIHTSGNIYDKIVGIILYDVDKRMQNDIYLYEAITKDLEKEYSDHRYYKQLKQDIYLSQLPPVKDKAPNIVLPDTSGIEISLYDSGGELVLIDFWASWCKPCRHENRTTVKPLYNKYREKGFKVFSVSFDENKSHWIKAIEDDQMSWTNVSDLKGRQSPVFKRYKIGSLPTTYLVDGNTFEVITKSTRGEALKRIVSEYLEKVDDR